MSAWTRVFAASALLSIAGGAFGNPEEIAAASGCQTCHLVETKVLGPSYKDIAAKHASDDEAAAKLFALVRAGSKDVWGPTPMLPVDSATISDGDLEAVIEWILSL